MRTTLITLLLAASLLHAVDYDWCLCRALEHSTDVAQAQTNLTANGIRLTKSRLAILPSLYASGGWTQESYGNRYLSGSVGVSNGYSLSNPFFLDWREYRLQERYLRRTLTKQQAQVALDVLDGYQACLAAQMALTRAVADTLYWAMQWQCCTSSAETRQQLYIALLEARMSHAAAQAALFAAMADLQEQTGAPLPDSAFCEPPLPVATPQPTQTDYHAQLYAHQYSLASDKLDLLRGNLGLLPELTLSAYYVSTAQDWLHDANRLYDYEGNYINRDTHESYWEVYAGATWYFMDILQSAQNKRLAKLNLRRDEREMQAEEQRLALEAEKQRVQLEALERQTRSAQERQQACNQLEQLVQMRWDGGRATFDELHIARQAAAAAATDLLSLQCALRRAALQYRASFLE